MDKIAFVMQLLPGCEEEYEKRHDEIWPELKDRLKSAGISDYSIYLDPQSLNLFAVLRRESGQEMDKLAADAVVQRWWDYMADIMETHPDNEPVQRPLRRVFQMD